MIDYKSECRIRHRIHRNQAVDLITLKLKFETVKPVSKQVSVSSVGYNVAGVDHRYKHYFSNVFAKPCDRLDNLKLYSVFGSGFLIDHALSIDVTISWC